MAEITVTLGGLTFNDGVADVNGAKWWVERIDGWDSPALRQALLEPSGAHGQVLASALHGGRPLVLAGDCHVTTAAGHDASRARLAAASNLLAPGALVVNETTPKRAGVVRAGPVRMRDYPGGGFTFEVPLLAPDPRKYSTAPQVTQANGAWLYNYGDIDTWPTWTIRGAATNPIILTHRLSGKDIRINRTLTTSEVLTIDTAERTVQVNGADVSSTIDSSTRWWPLTPGLNYLKPHQASLEDRTLGTTGWEAQLNCALARSTMHAADGVASLAVTALAATTNTQARTSSGTSGAPVTAGTQYSATVSVRALTAGRAGTLYIEWFDSSGGALANSSQSFTDTTGGWTTVALTATAPANSAFASVAVNFGAAVAAGEVHFVDKAGLFLGADNTWYRGSANYFIQSGVSGVVNTQWADAYV